MALPPKLQKKIVDFLISLPNIDDSKTRKALIYSAMLGQLQSDIDLSGSSAQFFKSFVPHLVQYGQLEDGRNALEAVLESAKSHVGQDKREYCDTLIQELQKSRRPPKIVTAPKNGIQKPYFYVIITLGVIGVVVVYFWLQRPQPITYIGRIIDNTTKVPIQGAKVLLDIRGAPPIVYTDSKGIYRFTVSLANDATLSGRVRIEAPGYQPYNRFIELSANNTSIEDIQLSPSSFEKHRRIDVAAPSQAEIGKPVDLLVQIRFSDSPSLEIDEWPPKEEGTLNFPGIRAISRLESSDVVEIRIITPDFKIEGEAQKRLEIPPDEYSKLTSFLLIPKRLGDGRINVETYSINNICLDTSPVKITVVEKMITPPEILVISKDLPPIPKPTATPTPTPTWTPPTPTPTVTPTPTPTPTVPPTPTPWSYERECEKPDEHSINRSNASEKLVLGQFGSIIYERPKYVEYTGIEIPQTDHLFLHVRYSKNSPSSVPIDVYLDDEETPRNSFELEKTGDLNEFTCTDNVDLKGARGGTHSIKFSTQGQDFGVADLDKFMLSNYELKSEGKDRFCTSNL